MWGGDVNTASLGEWPPQCRLPAKADEVPSGTQRLRAQDQGEPPRWRTSAVVWHEEGWAPPCDIVRDTPHVNDNHNSIHTGSVVARNKDRAFCCWPPVATLPGAWRYRVSTGTGRPGVSILWLGEVERWICNFCLSVAARKIVRADPSLRYTRLLLGC